MTALGEEMNSRGPAFVRQKKISELAGYSGAIARAEGCLARLKEAIQAKTAELEAMSSGYDDVGAQRVAVQQRLAALEAKREEQVKQLKSEHETELAAI